jgi:hypothetical protein
MNELDDRDSLDLALALTRSELSPSSADKARLRTALGLAANLIAPDAGGRDAAASPAARAPGAAAVEAAVPARLTALAALRASGRLGASLAAALFVAGVATGWGLRSRSPANDTAHEGERTAAVAVAAEVTAPAAAPAVAAVAAASAGELVRAEPASPRPERAVHPRGHAAAVPARSTAQPLDAELALLRRVERALRNSDPALALALLGELDERYPRTRLAEERLAARTIADCRLDRPEASAHARAFLREHSASVYSERVQSACAPKTTESAHAR